MPTKCKLSLMIDQDVYQTLELWLKKETEAKMAKGYEEMREENKAFAELTFEAQWETL